MNCWVAPIACNSNPWSSTALSMAFFFFWFLCFWSLRLLKELESHDFCWNLASLFFPFAVLLLVPSSWIPSISLSTRPSAVFLLSSSFVVFFLFLLLLLLWPVRLSPGPKRRCRLSSTVLKDSKLSNRFVDPGTVAAAAANLNLMASKQMTRCSGILACSSCGFSLAEWSITYSATVDPNNCCVRAARITVSSSPPLFSGSRKHAVALRRQARSASTSWKTSPERYVTLASYNQLDLSQRCVSKSKQSLGTIITASKPPTSTSHTFLIDSLNSCDRISRITGREIRPQITTCDREALDLMYRPEPILWLDR